VSDSALAALRPLWWFTSGVVAAAALASLASDAGSGPLRWALLALGGLAILLALTCHPRTTWPVWLAAGLALAGGRALDVRLEQLRLEEIRMASPEMAVRARVMVSEGWVDSRWGWRCQVRVRSALLAGRELPLPASCPLEVRGRVAPRELPRTGSVVEVLAGVRGESGRPLLVVSSPRLLQVVAEPAGVHGVRETMVQALLKAAGTDIGRIRAAELAGSLALGRRDLMSRPRCDVWRRSGLAHVLAVSGLNVGLVGGAVWLLARLLGMRPGPARAAVLVVLPGYAILAGASPPAMRAALMGMAYLGARLVGRAVLPMTAVLLATVALLLQDPELVTQAGFQLTVVITAALVRWTAALAERVPGPRWLTLALAVPVVAQLAAAPLVAWHFRNASPGAVLSNLAVPVLVTPLILLAVSATAWASLWPAFAAWQLDLIGLLDHALWLCGSAGRALIVTVPTMPVALAAALVVAGWLALSTGPSGRRGVVAWFAALGLGLAGWALMPAPPRHQAGLVPVSDGLAATVVTAEGVLLVDGGRFRDEAAELLADGGVRRLRAVVSTHTDDDHLGGLEQVMESCSVDQLVFPLWMLDDARAARLIRSARRQGTLLRPVARGTVLGYGDARLEVLWPPADTELLEDNERSLVARLRLPSGTILVAADIGHGTEAHLAGGTALACDVLLVPHHGSRSSSSPSFLDAAHPRVALIPAGERSLHHHPHAETLSRLRQRNIPFRFPAQSGWCGARPTADGRWELYP